MNAMVGKRTRMAGGDAVGDIVEETRVQLPEARLTKVGPVHFQQEAIREKREPTRSPKGFPGGGEGFSRMGPGRRRSSLAVIQHLRAGAASSRSFCDVSLFLTVVNFP